MGRDDGAGAVLARAAGMASPLKGRTLAGRIADLLREEILDGAHPPGGPLRQDALAALYGVSRIPVREALLQLEGEGLVRIEPHRGAIVAPLSAEEIADVFDLRLMLEPRLLRASLPRLEETDFAEMDRLQAAFAETIGRGDRSRWGELNAGLHLAMYRRAPMPRSLSIVASLLKAGERYTRLQLATPRAWAKAEAEHGALVALCRDRAIEPAAALLSAHIEAVRDDLLTLLPG